MANDIFPGAALVQLLEFGYPMGYHRPTPPANLAFSVIHITANLASAQNEAAWRLNDPGLQNSATFFVNQDGSVVQCLGDPLHMDPWTNGDVANPDLTNPRIAAMVRDGVNANERSLVTIENVGREPEAPITAAQEATNARIIAHYHAKAGVPVTRETVIGHYQINSVNRANCPSTNKSVIDRIVAAAGDDMDTGFKPAGPPIGTFTFVGDHQLISPLDLAVRYPRPSGSTFNVIAAVDLKNPDGSGVDVTGTSPPRNNWDQVYLVDAPAFGIAAYALRQDGTFTPAPTGGFTQAQLDAAVAKAAMDAKVAAAKAGAEGAASAAVTYAKSLPTP